MCWIKKLLLKVHDFFYPEHREKEEAILCVFLKQDSDFVFRSTQKDIQDPKLLMPVLIPLPDMFSMETNLSAVQDYLFKEFEIDPENITISYEYSSLAPLLPKTLFFATVDLHKKDVQTLLEYIEEDHCFVVASTPYIALHEEDNLFFPHLLKMLEKE